ncbi:MAG TPA: PAS domain-containing protein, partial [Rhodocyclaceae bacterium]|nr:PAS domain-containing protein [Rhodocyclaceae bacterium]
MPELRHRHLPRAPLADAADGGGAVVDGGKPASVQTLLELKAILENATVGIIFTRNRIVVQANPVAAQMWGYEQVGEMIG